MIALTMTDHAPGPARRRFRRLAASHAAAVLLAVGLPVPAAAELALNDAVYSKRQARAGRKLYDQHCISCHERGYFRQVLRAREGETLQPLFEAMVALMPQNAPGSLSDDEYVELIAYILSQARYAAGDERLTTGRLKGIVIGPGG